jgi:ABC-type enterochelin transport system permease subunit
MNLTHVIIGLVVGIVIGAMDFSLARSIAAMIRPGNARALQAVMLGGFTFRLGLIGITLWLLSRSGGISFVAVCVGLTGAFTVLTLGHAIRSYGGTARIHKQASDRR